MMRKDGTVRRCFSFPSALLVSLAFVGSACGSSTTNNPTPVAAGTSPSGSATPEVTGTVTVSAAASLTGPFKKIIDGFEAANPGVEVTPTFDSSGTLATQITNGAPVDVFASADDANMGKLTDAGLTAGTPTRFARNKLAIVVKKGNPKGVKTLDDLGTVGTVSLCGATVPCGKYADQILQQAGVTIPGYKVTRGQNVKATFTAVAEGDAEAGIVYLTDITGDKAEAVTIPDEQNAIANYPIAAVKASKNPTAADAFIAYVTGPSGQAALQAAGFLPPS